MRAVALAREFAETGLPILLVGATGTGKELFAQCIHEWSGCRGPFVDINCGALPKEMVESLLFGHRRGAFTGAVDGVDGLVTASDGGTLFLDEFSSLPPEAQVKLLRVLETGEVRRVGEAVKRSVRFRVIAAVQDDLDQRLEQGDLRLDLYQRVAGLVLGLPPLRARSEDLWALALHFAASAGFQLQPECRLVIEGYHWPANARELKFVVERAGRLSKGASVGAPQVAEAIELGLPPGQVAVQRAARGLRLELEALLERHGGNVRAAAGELGISRSALYRRIQARRVGGRRGD